MPIKSSFLTFLSTEIEGGRQLWDRHPEAMRAALARHDALIRQAIETFQGTVFNVNDGFILAAFPDASHAAGAASAGQRAMLSEPWGAIPIRVKMALHSGPAMEIDGGYLGPTLYHLVHLMKATHGSQILLSRTVRDQLEADSQFELRDVGTHELLDLYSREACFQLVSPGLPANFPPLHTLDHYASNLPIQTTCFIGREKEITEIGHLLAGANPHTFPPVAPCRLVTLVGAGGMGKTRLALQVAASWLEHFPDGAWFIEIGALVDPDLLPLAIAKVLGICFQTHQNLPAALVDYLRPRQMLLILDQCEHMQEACAELADTLLRMCPNLKLLVASREALKIPGETAFQIPGLSLPEHEEVQPLKSSPEGYIRSDAVTLFTERAASIQPDFVLTEQNAPVIAQICQRLDGIPLAIELTATRVKTLPLDSILVRIENRFRLLTGSPRAPLSHTQIGRAIFDWSFDLLSPSERTLLGRLAVFANGWTLEAAAAVCADDDDLVRNIERRSGVDRRVATSPWNGPERRSGIDRRSLVNEVIPAASIPDLLAHLLEKNLAYREAARGQSRYRMPGIIRQLSREKLLGSGEANRLHRRHLSYFTGLAIKADQNLWLAEQYAWLQRISAEIDNIRIALEWAEASPEPAEVEAGLKLLGALWQYWIVSGCWSEGSQRLERFFARSDVMGPTPDMARALNLAGILAARNRDTAMARQYLKRAQDIGEALGDQLKIAHSFYGLGFTALVEDDSSVAQGYYEASLSLFRRLDHQAGITVVLRELGELALRNNEAETARQYLEESKAMCQRMENGLGAAQAAKALGTIFKARGEFAAARQNYEEALTVFREIEDWPGIAETLMGLGLIASSSTNAEGGPNLPAARTYLEESLEIYRKLGQKKRVAFLLTRLDEVARSQGDHNAAQNFYEESLTILGELSPSGGVIASLNDLGKTSLLESDPHQAAFFFQEALALATETGDKPGIATNLLGLTQVFIQMGKMEQLRLAARLMGHAELLLENIASDPGPEVRKELEAACSSLLSKLGENAFAASRAEGRAIPLSRAISYGLEKIPSN